MSMSAQERLTWIELASFRRYLRKKGYTDGTINNIISSLNRLIEENGRILDPDEIADAYWEKSKALRHWRRYAAKKYQEYRKKEREKNKD